MLLLVVTLLVADVALVAKLAARPSPLKGTRPPAASLLCAERRESVRRLLSGQEQTCLPLGSLHHRLSFVKG